jgi:hypothetical protein
MILPKVSQNILGHDIAKVSQNILGHDKLSLGFLFLHYVFEFKIADCTLHIYSTMSLLSFPKTFILKHVFLLVVVIFNVKVVTINLEQDFSQIVVIDPIKDSLYLTLAINRKSVHEGVNAH